SRSMSDFEARLRTTVISNHPLQRYSWRNMTVHLQAANSQTDTGLIQLSHKFSASPVGRVISFSVANKDHNYEYLIGKIIQIKFPVLHDEYPELAGILLDSILYRYYRCRYVTAEVMLNRPRQRKASKLTVEDSV